MMFATSWLICGTLEILLIAGQDPMASPGDTGQVAIRMVRLSRAVPGLPESVEAANGQIVLEYQNAVLDEIQVYLEARPNRGAGRLLARKPYVLTREKKRREIPIELGTYLVDVQISSSPYRAAQIVKIEEQIPQVIRIIGRLVTVSPAKTIPQAAPQAPAKSYPAAPSKTMPVAVPPLNLPEMASVGDSRPADSLVVKTGRIEDLAEGPAVRPSEQAPPVVLATPQSASYVELEISFDRGE